MTRSYDLQEAHMKVTKHDKIQTSVVTITWLFARERKSIIEMNYQEKKGESVEKEISSFIPINSINMNSKS